MLGDEVHCDDKNEYEDVYLLLRSLYGPRQAPRVWYEHLESALHALDLRPIKHAESSFTGTIDGAPITVIVYVDDMWVITSCDRALAKFKIGLQSPFDMQDFQAVKYFLNVAIERRRRSYVLSQMGYVVKVFNAFNMQTSRPVAEPTELSHYAVLTERRQRTDKETATMANVPYRRLAGILLYLSTNTRPYIVFATSILSRHMSAPLPLHWNAGKRVPRYLCGTSDVELNLTAANLRLSAYADADWEGGSDRLSVSGNVVLLGCAPVVCRSVKQPCTALSTTEAEYVSLSTVARDVRLLRSLCSE